MNITTQDQMSGLTNHLLPYRAKDLRVLNELQIRINLWQKQILKSLIQDNCNQVQPLHKIVVRVNLLLDRFQENDLSILIKFTLITFLKWYRRLRVLLNLRLYSLLSDYFWRTNLTSWSECRKSPLSSSIPWCARSVFQVSKLFHIADSRFYLFR